MLFLQTERGGSGVDGGGGGVGSAGTMLGFSWQSSSKCSSFTPLNSSAEGHGGCSFTFYWWGEEKQSFLGSFIHSQQRREHLFTLGRKKNLKICGDSYCILSVCLNHSQHQICLTWRLLSVVVTLSTSTLYEAKHLHSGVHLVVVVTGVLLWNKLISSPIFEIDPMQQLTCIWGINLCLSLSNNYGLLRLNSHASSSFIN